MDPQQQQPEPLSDQPPAPSPLPAAPTPENQQPVSQPEEPQQFQQSPAQPNDEHAQDFDEAQDNEPQMEAVSWEASESVHHEKDALWFAGMLSVAALLSILSIFIIKSWTFSILIVVMATALIVLAKRPPRIMQYEMTDDGIVVNGKHHPFNEFRAFGIVEDGPFYYVSLLPIKRFMPAMDVYFPEEYGEDIVDLLGSRIPMQTITPDMLDIVTKKLRF